jgi:hypothetical protein
MQLEGRLNIQTERKGYVPQCRKKETKSGPATAPSLVGVAKALSDSTLTTLKTSDPGIARASVFVASSGVT